jgi:hypothetical protein
MITSEIDEEESYGHYKGSSVDPESSKASQPRAFARFGLAASGAPTTLKQLLESTCELNAI